MTHTFVYEKYRPELLLRYGISLDDTTASILFVMLEEQKKTFEEQNLNLENSIKKLNSGNKSLEVDYKNPKMQAFWLGMGKSGFFMTLITTIIALFIYNYVETKNSANTTYKELAAYKQYYIQSKSAIKKKNK